MQEFFWPGKDLGFVDKTVGKAFTPASYAFVAAVSQSGRLFGGCFPSGRSSTYEHVARGLHGIEEVHGMDPEMCISQEGLSFSSPFATRICLL